MSTPIVFVHRGSGGDFNYLNYAALQARLSNPRSTIYVLGDQAARQSLVVPGLKLMRLEDDLDSVIPLRSIYQHYRVNSPEYTLFCMERWFHLRAFMKREGLERILHLDGDVMVYADVEEEMGGRFNSCDLTLSRGLSTFTTSITFNAVNRLCELMLSTYRDSSALSQIQRRWDRAREFGCKWGGVGDMYFMQQLARKGGLAVRETFHGHDPVFDCNIRKGEGYETRDGIKRIEFKNGAPFAFREVDGEPRRFATLHFQYLAKSLMPQFLHLPSGATVPSEFLIHLLREAGARIAAAEAGRRQETEAGQRQEAERTCSAEKVFTDTVKRMSLQITELKQQLKTTERAVREVTLQVESVVRSRWFRLGTLLRLTSAHAQLTSIVDRLRKIGTR